MQEVHLSPAKLKAALARFRRLRILVVGDLMLDEFIYGRVSRISPEAPVPVVHVEKETTYPGGAANVARNLAALGIHAELGGGVGQDEAGWRAGQGDGQGAMERSALPVLPAFPLTQPSSKPASSPVNSRWCAWTARSPVVSPHKTVPPSFRKPFASCLVATP